MTAGARLPAAQFAHARPPANGGGAPLGRRGQRGDPGGLNPGTQIRWMPQVTSSGKGATCLCRRGVAALRGEAPHTRATVIRISVAVGTAMRRLAVLGQRTAPGMAAGTNCRRALTGGGEGGDGRGECPPRNGCTRPASEGAGADIAVWEKKTVMMTGGGGNESRSDRVRRGAAGVIVTMTRQVMQRKSRKARLAVPSTRPAGTPQKVVAVGSAAVGSALPGSDGTALPKISTGAHLGALRRTTPRTTDATDAQHGAARRSGGRRAAKIHPSTAVHPPAARRVHGRTNAAKRAKGAASMTGERTQTASATHAAPARHITDGIAWRPKSLARRDTATARS